MKDQVIADRYKILLKLGSGATAVVYKVIDLTLNKVCALKTIKNRQADPKLLVRFQREAKAVSSLRHPNIVSILDFGLDKSNNPFIVMDYVEGQTLREYVKQHGPLSVPQTLNVFIQACDAMSYTHKHKILHRDLKSANLIISAASSNNEKNKIEPEELFIQILDFGLAKGIEGAVDERLTQTGVSIGTPTYMSPEQAAGKSLDERSDLYSLGCVIFESLTGKLPFVGDTVFETINKQINEVAPSLQLASGEEFPPIVESIVAKTLKKDPDKRYQSMEELLEQLENVVKLLEPAYEEAPIEVGIDYRKVVFQVVKLGPKLLIPFIILLLFGSVFILFKINNTQIKSVLSNAKNQEFDNLSYISKFEPATWELGLKWHKKYKTYDNDLLRLTAKDGIENLALYKEKKFTDKGLKHVLSLPLSGIGYGDCNITKDQLKMTVEAKPNLKYLYIGGLLSLKDEDLELVSKLKNLRFLGISRSNYTDNCFKYLTKLKKLDTLKAFQIPKINGTGLKYLKALPNLKRIVIGDNNISIAGWKELSKLENLTLVSIPGANLTDDGISQLTHLKNLEKLDIRSNHRVTDKGFMQLKKLKKLKILYINNLENVSISAFKELKKALPNCDIDPKSKYNLEYGDHLLLSERL